MELRPYQREAVDAVYAHLRGRDDNPCVVIPTAGGKTPVMAAICRDAVELWGGRVLILAHVKELLEQAVEKLRLMAPDLWMKVGVYSAGLKSRDTDHPILVAGIQSVYRRACDLGRFDLILIDEAHMIPPDGEGMYRTFLNETKVVNPNVRLVGLTATPYRMTTGMICAPENVLNHVCYEVGVRELIVQGYLCPLRTKSGSQRPDYDRLHVRGGEFIANEVEDLMDDDALVRSACREIVQHAADRRSVLIFASGVRHGEHVVRVLREHHDAECGFVCGETPSGERAETLRRFRDGGLKYLCNVNVLTTGFDAPNIDCVAMLRPTLSPGLYYQMCLDMETEVMTPRGWARCTDVKVGDTVAAFDLGTGGIVFGPALDMVHRPLAPGESMYGVSAPHLDIRVTDRHTMIYKGRSKTCRHWRRCESRQLSNIKDSFLVPVAGSTDGPGVPLADDELRFLGWLLTDGYRNPANNAVIISQSANSLHLPNIESMLRGCGFGYRVYRQERTGQFAHYAPAMLYVVPYGQPRGPKRGLRGWKHLADYLNRPVMETLTAISRRQLRILLEAMNLGDGAKHRPKDRTKRTFDICLGEHRFLADQMQALCVLRGFRCNVAVARQRTAWHSREPRPQYILHIREQRAATIGGSGAHGNALIPNRSRFGPVPFDPAEKVWCLTTTQGTLVTRRRGKVCVVGNCGRGFRLHPGKADCLVLDYGGNVLRHGPVDQIRIEAPGEGKGEAPAKECPQCHEVIAAGYATCPACGYAFPPPQRTRHDAVAGSEGILSDQASRTEYEVAHVFYAVHTRRDAPPEAPRTMRVDYRIGFSRYVSEWVCFEHAGYARRKAELWWRARSVMPVPDTAADAVELANAGALAPTLAVTVEHKPGEKYDRVVGYRLGEKPPDLESEEGLPEYAGIDTEDVPF